MALKLEALEKVREAERQVRDLKAKAEDQRERRLRKAKGEALTLEDELRQQADKRYQEVFAAAAEATDAERRRILDEGGKEAEKVKTAAADRVERAVEFLLRRFEEAVRAET